MTIDPQITAEWKVARDAQADLVNKLGGTAAYITALRAKDPAALATMRGYHDASRRRLSRITGVEIVAVVVS